MITTSCEASVQRMVFTNINKKSVMALLARLLSIMLMMGTHKFQHVKFILINIVASPEK